MDQGLIIQLFPRTKNFGFVTLCFIHKPWLEHSVDSPHQHSRKTIWWPYDSASHQLRQSGRRTAALIQIADANCNAVHVQEVLL
jgi:hypothetical protein